MKAVILGCSHAAGAEMYRDPDRVIDDPDSFGWLNSYPVQIARQLGYQARNHAVTGGSNDAMFRTFVEQLPSLTREDMVIACWTGTDRTEIWHDIDQQWLPLSVGQHNFNPVQASPYALSGLNVGGKISLENEYRGYLAQWTRFHVNLQANKLNKLKNILALNSLAQARSIPVININSFYPVDLTDTVTWAVKEPFCDWCDQQGYSRTEWGHYFLNAHQAFADHVVGNLTANSYAV
jgi:hypothetical protein